MHRLEDIKLRHGKPHADMKFYDLRLKRREMQMDEDKDKYSYDDIINLPHPTSDKHPRMSLYDRAAQFAPFAALDGYEEAIKETVRLAEEE